MKTKLVVTSGFDARVGDEPASFVIGQRITDAALIKQIRESHPAHVVAATLTDEEVDELKEAEAGARAQDAPATRAKS